MNLSPILLFLLFLSSCNSVNSNPKRDQRTQSTAIQNLEAEKISLQHLFELISSHDKTAKLRDNEILIGATSIALKINVDFEGQKGTQWIHAANFSTSYRTKAETIIDIGAIGIGATKNEAAEVAIQEWYGTFAVAFTSMLFDVNGIVTSNHKIFAGPMAIRGTLPESWGKSSDMNDKIIPQLKDILGSLDNEITPIDIKLMFGRNGISDGECRINNQVSVELFSALKKIDWPVTKEKFMFKQFYLIKKI